MNETFLKEWVALLEIYAEAGEPESVLVNARLLLRDPEAFVAHLQGVEARAMAERGIQRVRLAAEEVGDLEMRGRALRVLERIVPAASAHYTAVLSALARDYARRKAVEPEAIRVYRRATMLASPDPGLLAEIRTLISARATSG